MWDNKRREMLTSGAIQNNAYIYYSFWKRCNQQEDEKTKKEGKEKYETQTARKSIYYPHKQPQNIIKAANMRCLRLQLNNLYKGLMNQ